MDMDMDIDTDRALTQVRTWMQTWSMLMSVFCRCPCPCRCFSSYQCSCSRSGLNFAMLISKDHIRTWRLHGHRHGQWYWHRHRHRHTDTDTEVERDTVSDIDMEMDKDIHMDNLLGGSLCLQSRGALEISSTESSSLRWRLSSTSRIPRFFFISRWNHQESPHPLSSGSKARHYFPSCSALWAET